MNRLQTDDRHLIAHHRDIVNARSWTREPRIFKRRDNFR